jgi:hypothetical protein
MNLARSFLLILLVGPLHSLGTGSAFANEKCAGLAGAKTMVTIIDRFLHFAEARQKDLGLQDEQIQKLRATGLAIEKAAIKARLEATSMLTPENREKVRQWWRQALEKEAGKSRRLEGHDSEAATKPAEETESRRPKP